jgi:hypothetical protein
MKFAILLIAVITLNSCNTSIGIWRDTKQACSWTQQKIQDSKQVGGGAGDEYGAPVY